MPGLSQLVKRGDDYREVLFWLLLLGSWQCLVARRGRYTVLGAVGTAAFLAFACRNLGRLKGLGLAYAAWLPATRARLRVAAVSGLVAGAGVLAIGSANGKSMMLSDDWGLVVLQVTLGPVLEEVVFRGYLFAVLTWWLSKFTEGLLLERLVVVTSAAVFALAHFTQPGVSWLQLVCITWTGILYGWIRYSSKSTALSAASHAVYNLTLYAAAGIVTVAR
jgi:membrane protease YdiL (CAAX protease family)